MSAPVPPCPAALEASLSPTASLREAGRYSVTTAQREILRYIAGYQAAHGGVSPTHAEICAALGFASKSIANRILAGLEERGMIRRLRQRERAIEVLHPVAIPRTPEGAPLYFVPVERAGMIAARAAEAGADGATKGKAA